MAADRVFVDTNVLIYATRRTASERAAAKAALARLEGEGRGLWISFQVLHEYLAAVTRPRPHPPRCRWKPQSPMCDVSSKCFMSPKIGRSCWTATLPYWAPIRCRPSGTRREYRRNHA